VTIGQLIRSRCCQRSWGVVLVIFGFSIVFAQPAPGLDLREDLSQYVHQIWTIQNGLPTSDVQSITQTRDGYLWVGTEDGLARFDGTRFQVFDKASGQLPGNYIYCLFEDLDGALWIGTNGGLVRYQAGKFQIIGADADLADAFVYGIAQDRGGTLWISANYKLWRYSKKIFTCFDPLEQGGNLGGVIDVTVDKADAVWVILKGGIVCRFRDNHFQSVPQFTRLKGQGLERISTDSEGDVWISNFSGGAYRYYNGEVKEFSKDEGLIDIPSSRVIRSRDGTVWLGTDQGLARIVNGSCTQFGFDTYINAVYEDREGNLWVGSNGNGLQRFSDGSFTSFESEDGLSGGAVMAVCEDSAHNLWLAKSDGVYCRSGGRFVRAIAAKDRLGGDLRSVELLANPRDNGIWIGTSRGLFYFKGGGALTQYSLSDGLPSDSITALYLDHQMMLWIGCDAGLVCLKEGRFVTPAELVRVTRGKSIRNLVEDHQGGLWIATASGPMRYEGNQVTQFGRKDGLLSIACFQMYVGADGIIWLSTWNGGLSQYTGNGFFTYTQKDGLPSDQIYGIIDDPMHGDLWLGSERGIFKISQNQLTDFRSGKTKHIFGMTFGVGDGLGCPTINADGKPNVTRTNDGKLWWCLDQGAAVVDPKDLALHNTPGPTIIESVVADDCTITGDNPELSPGTRRLEIGYASLTYAAADKVQFRYRLDGVDRNWFDAGQRREATFTNLGPGHYQFRVQASADGGATWHRSGAELAFYIRPRFYETWCFFLICGAMLIALVWAAFLLRRHRLEAHFRAVIAERVRVAGEIHDSIAQGFASAAMLLDSLDRVVPPDSPLRLRLKSIRHILGSSLTDARAMIATLRGQPGAKEDLEVALQKLVESLEPISSVPITLDLESDKIPSVSDAVQQELIRICQEGINNAIKHASADHVWLRLRSSNGKCLVLTIGDDGKGFDVTRATGSGDGLHFGLIVLSERAVRVGAELEIRSEPGRGTEIVLRLPLALRDTYKLKM
jgi:ligand-binding sensor domain-containing protein/signal transduction histidine kinase